MNKRTYMKLCQEQSSEFLQACIDNPTPFCRPVHLAIIKIVLRKRGIAIQRFLQVT